MAITARREHVGRVVARVDVPLDSRAPGLTETLGL